MIYLSKRRDHSSCIDFFGTRTHMLVSGIAEMTYYYMERNIYINIVHIILQLFF